MEANDQVKMLAERLVPQLQECMVQGFMLFAYMSDVEGKISRVTLGGVTPGSNPALMDGLRPVERIANAWSAGQL